MIPKIELNDYNEQRKHPALNYLITVGTYCFKQRHKTTIFDNQRLQNCVICIAARKKSETKMRVPKPNNILTVDQLVVTNRVIWLYYSKN